MNPAHATAEVFWTAFSVLPEGEKTIFLRRLFNEEALLKQKELLQDLIDFCVSQERKNGDFVDLKDFLDQEGY